MLLEEILPFGLDLTIASKSGKLSIAFLTASAVKSYSSSASIVTSGARLIHTN